MSTIEAKLSAQEETARVFREATRRALEVGCPRCRASVGQECFTRNGVVRRPHSCRAHLLIRSGEVV